MILTKECHTLAPKAAGKDKSLKVVKSSTKLDSDSTTNNYLTKLRLTSLADYFAREIIKFSIPATECYLRGSDSSMSSSTSVVTRSGLLMTMERRNGILIISHLLICFERSPRFSERLIRTRL